jgi:hypothetical protein
MQWLSVHRALAKDWSGAQIAAAPREHVPHQGGTPEHGLAKIENFQKIFLNYGKIDRSEPA